MDSEKSRPAEALNSLELLISEVQRVEERLEALTTLASQPRTTSEGSRPGAH